MNKSLGMLLDEAEIKIEMYVSNVMKEYNIPPSLMEYLVTHVLSNVRETKYKEYVTQVAENEKLEPESPPESPEPNAPEKTENEVKE